MTLGPNFKLYFKRAQKNILITQKLKHSEENRNQDR